MIGIPYDPGAEAAALGYTLLFPSDLHRLEAIVSRDDFYVPAHRRIFEALVNSRRATWSYEELVALPRQVAAATGLDVADVKRIAAQAVSPDAAHRIASTAKARRRMAVVARIYEDLSQAGDSDRLTDELHAGWDAA